LRPKKGNSTEQPGKQRKRRTRAKMEQKSRTGDTWMKTQVDSKGTARVTGKGQRGGAQPLTEQAMKSGDKKKNSG